MSSESELISIEPGDLILHIRHEEHDAGFRYRVSSKTIRQNSRYFDSLLSDRFNEGRILSEGLVALKQAGYSAPAEAPSHALPTIQIVHVGRISKVSSIRDLAADFLRALHGQPLPEKFPVTNLANIAVLADRFDALDYFKAYIHRKKYLVSVDARLKASKTRPTEERIRQKLLIGLLFDYGPWITSCSKHLILRDSAQWKEGVEMDGTAALWWDLPNGVEDELIFRRECILETINSLQAHFLKLYTSGARQCKLGYDSSGQCDSFQLGEMIRFFLRQGTLRLQGTIYDATEPSHYSGDVDRLIESLRQVPSYQIDGNHHHCGIRVRISPWLDYIQGLFNSETGSAHIGICGDCWTQHRAAYAWSDAKRPVSWSPPVNLPKPHIPLNAWNQGPKKHASVRDMFMAVERNWTAPSG
ncbi:uncharacterized protein EI97DRAFT_441997 [Westerdykella ornata]|uniref:Uncharacterized protein n=1 Tax=Westerdykella ornata TaxID=318751 RepID=A0A6A6JL84_WESOR|nr:uncharacterized protein EI97DRAFT_441997 [Westerdykella ornata]KAF2277262.1 hypothetical protein EI97DRAFT_441997 [Westerdykella ornata]